LEETQTNVINESPIINTLKKAKFTSISIRPETKIELIIKKGVSESWDEYLLRLVASCPPV
jgi:hypothetical protein